MSLPSDVTPDIPPARTPVRADLRSLARGTPLTTEQQGWIVAAFVAFFGVAYLGPAIARYRRRPSLKERMSRRLHDTKRQAQAVGLKARRRVHRLGGGSVRR